MGEKRKLPEGWAEATIGDVTLNKVPRAEPDTDSFFTYVDISSIDNASKEIVSPKELHGEQAPSRARQRLAVNDVLVSMTRPNLNAVALIPDSLNEAIASTGFDILRSIEVEPKWLYLHVRSGEFVEDMSALVKGALYPAIKSNDVRSYRIPIPPLKEQKRIVAKMEELQSRSRRAWEALETVPNLLEQLRQSILAAAFRGDLTRKWRNRHRDVEPASELLKRICTERRKRWEAAELEKLKTKGLTGDKLDAAFAKQQKKYKEPVPVDTSDLLELPEGWCWATADQLTEFVTDGEHKTPNRSDSGIPLLSARNIQNGYISYDNVDFVPGEVYESLKKRLEAKEGDVLMSCSGSLGRTCVVRKKDRFAMVRSVALLRPVIHKMAQFISFGIMSPFLQNQIDDKKTQTAQANIFQGKIRTLIFPIATMKEQKLICDKVEDAFGLYGEIGKITNTNLDRLNLQNQSILSKAFRGELVPQNPKDEPASILLERIREEKDREAAKQKPKDKRRGRKMKKKKDEQKEVLVVLRQASRAMTPEEVFVAGGFEEDSVDAFYEQLRKAVVSKQIREMREGDLIQLEAIGK